VAGFMLPLAASLQWAATSTASDQPDQSRPGRAEFTSLACAPCAASPVDLPAGDLESPAAITAAI
jgi:hypothetical protein